MTNSSATDGVPKRLVFLLAEVSNGGIAKATISLARGLAKRGWATSVIALEPAERASPQLLESLRAAGVDISFLGVRTSAAVGPVRAALKRLRPHAIVSAASQVNLLAIYCRAVASPSARLVLTEHTLAGWLWRSAPSAKILAASLARTLLYRRADHVVAICGAIADELRAARAVRASRLRVIYNSVLNEELEQGARQRPTHPWLAERHGQVVIALGHLIEPKGFDILLRAFARVRMQMDARLVIFGDGHQRGNLERLRSELGIDAVVDMPGSVANPYAEIAAADLLVSASLVEAFQLTICEALCLGVPVVAADAEGGMSDLLDGGRLGRLVPIRDDAALAAAIVETLRDHAGARRIDAVVRDRFDEAAVLDRWEELLGPGPTTS